MACCLHGPCLGNLPTPHHPGKATSAGPSTLLGGPSASSCLHQGQNSRKICHHLHFVPTSYHTFRQTGRMGLGELLGRSPRRVPGSGVGAKPPDSSKPTEPEASPAVSACTLGATDPSWLLQPCPAFWASSWPLSGPGPWPHFSCSCHAAAITVSSHFLTRTPTAYSLHAPDPTAPANVPHGPPPGPACHRPHRCGSWPPLKSPLPWFP